MKNFVLCWVVWGVLTGSVFGQASVKPVTILPAKLLSLINQLQEDPASEYPLSQLPVELSKLKESSWAIKASALEKLLPLCIEGPSASQTSEALLAYLSLPDLRRLLVHHPQWLEQQNHLITRKHSALFDVFLKAQNIEPIDYYLLRQLISLWHNYAVTEERDLALRILNAVDMEQFDFSAENAVQVVLILSLLLDVYDLNVELRQTIFHKILTNMNIYNRRILRQIFTAGRKNGLYALDLFPNYHELLTIFLFEARNAAINQQFFESVLVTIDANTVGGKHHTADFYEKVVAHGQSMGFLLPEPKDIILSYVGQDPVKFAARDYNYVAWASIRSEHYFPFSELHPEVRYVVISLFADKKERRARALLEHALFNESKEKLRLLALGALAQIGSGESLDNVLKHALASSGAEQLKAIEVLRKLPRQAWTRKQIKSLVKVLLRIHKKAAPEVQAEISKNFVEYLQDERFEKMHKKMRKHL